MLRRREIQRRVNPPVHRDQMRRELDRHLLLRREAQLLLDLGEMPVLRHAVGAHAFVALAEEIIHLRLAPRAAHPAHRIRDDPLRLDQLRPQERQHRQQDARGITPRRRDQHRSLDLAPVNLRQSIHTLRQQLRRRMIVTVKFLVTLRALQPEIRAQINHHAARVDQRHRELRRHAMRQRQEDNLRLLREQLRVRLSEAQAARRGMTRELREHLPHRQPRALPARHRRQLDLRMLHEQPHQFLARVTRRADHRHFLLHHGNHREPEAPREKEKPSRRMASPNQPGASRGMESGHR